MRRTQWSASPKGLVRAESQRIGAICFSHGIVWAGDTLLFYSTDTGKTWNQSQSFPEAGISDIAFYDSLNGLVSTYDYGVYQTQDGGLTWNNLNQLSGGLYHRVAFNGSASVMNILEYSPGTMYSTTDAGNTWKPIGYFGGVGLSFAIGADKTVYVVTNGGNNCWINYSTDLGTTWSGNGTDNPDEDSQGLAADSCDIQRLYLVNESTVDRESGSTRIDVTPDVGQSWQTIASHSLDYYSGSIANTSQVIYVTTDAGGKGVLRSTDAGASWESIGGPMTCYDTHSIALASNNIVFVLDSNGTVWTTLNSGGDSLVLGASNTGKREPGPQRRAETDHPSQSYHRHTRGTAPALRKQRAQQRVPA